MLRDFSEIAIFGKVTKFLGDEDRMFEYLVAGPAIALLVFGIIAWNGWFIVFALAWFIIFLLIWAWYCENHSRSRCRW